MLFVFFVLCLIFGALNAAGPQAVVWTIVAVGGLLGIAICRGFQEVLYYLRRAVPRFRCPRCLGGVRGQAKACPHCQIELEWLGTMPIDPVEERRRELQGETPAGPKRR